MNKDKKREALLYHAKPTPGKIQVVPTKIYATQRDLSWLILLGLLSLVGNR
jgi:malate dehydrogenase (oxaloacetate-decarboxylating)(NADP+)